MDTKFKKKRWCYFRENYEEMKNLNSKVNFYSANLDQNLKITRGNKIKIKLQVFFNEWY